MICRCPQCQAPANPWKLLNVSGWKFYTCPSCQAVSNVPKSHKFLLYLILITLMNVMNSWVAHHFRMTGLVLLALLIMGLAVPLCSLLFRLRPLNNEEKARMSRKTKEIPSLPLSVSLAEPLFAERWVKGTYVVSEVFFLDGTGLTKAQIQSDIALLTHEVKKKQKTAWLKWLTRSFVIPIYSAPSFDKATITSIRWSLRSCQSLWPEPLLYSTSDNAVAFREDFAYHGRAFYPYLSKIFREGLALAAGRAGGKNPPQISEIP